MTVTLDGKTLFHVLLDEPASGLTEAEVVELGILLTAIKAIGVIVVLVEHNLKFVLGVADHIVVLDFGAVLASGSPKEIRGSRTVQQHYMGVGRRVTARERAGESDVSGGMEAGGDSDIGIVAQPVLAVAHLSSGYGDLRAVWDVDLNVVPGRTTVVLGNNGAGKTTTLMAIAGVLPVLGGEVRYKGAPIERLSASSRTRAGLALVQEGKRVFPGLTVGQNLMLGGWTIRSRNHRVLAQQAELMFDRFPALAAKRNAVVSSLSGGQQQMLAIAQALMPSPTVLMLDEPSAGLAPAIMEEHCPDPVSEHGGDWRFAS